jgi:tRNA A-37 threonylcarbamoyl transferase component Bud32
MLNIRESGSGCKWSMIGDMIVKHLNWDMDPRWFTTYNKLREYEPRLIEVYEYRDRKIYMQFIDGELLRDNITLDRYLEVCDILKNIGNFCIDNNITFINHAMQLRNFMIENNTGKIYMIDVDSFMFYDENSSS